MKTINLLFLSTIVCAYTIAQTETFHDFSARTIEGNILDMATLAGKKVLVVNTASYCGFTPQYDELQQLYDQYGSAGFEILGFPANDFNDQEPGDDSTILDFCTDQYGVTFQMMSKISVVNQDSMPELYKWLTDGSRNGVQNAPVSWNFQKFMINEDGTWHGMVSSATSPLGQAIVSWITAVGIEPGDKRAIVQNVYPNPTEGVVTVNPSGLVNEGRGSYALYSCTGPVVEKFLISGSDVRFTLDLTHLPKGVYYLKPDQSVVGTPTKIVLR